MLRRERLIHVLLLCLERLKTDRSIDWDRNRQRNEFGAGIVVVVFFVGAIVRMCLVCVRFDARKRIVVNVM